MLKGFDFFQRRKHFFSCFRANSKERNKAFQTQALTLFYLASIESNFLEPIIHESIDELHFFVRTCILHFCRVKDGTNGQGVVVSSFTNVVVSSLVVDFISELFLSAIANR